ncbi:circularly permuted type 2 ATP-grasp protein [Solirubrobacter sp. CPCC 204708]|uniref:Circularly permuted type 2 ATP-grasp protein n=1 Tax=Solirubrobacter deserti TaxID=2282478 RepID=A0ABT4RJG4_9ACTN|nr:circularly permuted type 2 ATP-grasp protein [Solirubrobacter deserti]MBE2317663.1 circularly permuted type 2 ATP-grasp protein [Solirubrobacter deserti]MDA0138613.1 circularly permuted type 2 ATP-grasp protein [Solirubrobacter deserti]
MIAEPSAVEPRRALAAAAALRADVARERIVHGAGPDEHLFHVDPVPRAFAVDEWETLSRGMVQRVRALEAFAADAHGGRHAVHAGVVPADVLATSRYLEPALPVPHRYIGFAGPDVVRDGEGRLVVLEDNVRTPTMVLFALALRRLVARHVDGGPDPQALATRVRETLWRMLRAASPAPDPNVAVLGDLGRSALRWELRATAELLGVPLLELDDVRTERDRLIGPDGRAIDVLWRRTSEERLRDDAGELNALGRALLGPIEAGTLAVVNAFGAGIADDKRVFPYVEDVIRFFLCEEPLLRSVPTFDAASTLERAHELVLKPRSGSGGYGVCIGPHATRDQLDEVRAAVERDPGEWIAQEPVALSTHPTVVGGRLEPRHVDLRPFACWDGERHVVLPVAFTRVALERDNLIVNASQGGGGKDTWVPA